MEKRSYDESIDFTIMVATYKSPWESLRLTLDSVINQKDIETEIIVCDDGSPDTHFSEISDYLKEKCYPINRLTLISDGENHGTVASILRAMRVAKSKYFKGIGAGDLLYDEYTLRDIKKFMEENDAECVFGMMRGYRFTEGEDKKNLGGKIKAMPHFSPRDIKAYREENYEKINHNLALCEDWVSGAAIFATTDYFVKYVGMLEGTVRYCEDWATAMAAVDGIYLKLYDRYAVWYEVGDGISTSPNPEFRKKLKEDNDAFWGLFEGYCERQKNTDFKKYKNKRERKKSAETIKSGAVQLAVKSLLNPDMVLYEMEVRQEEKEGLHYPRCLHEGFLDA